MDKRILQTVKATALSGCVLLMFASCKPNDTQIAKSVTSAVSALAPHVTATVKDGMVTLSGMVPGNAAKSTLDSTVKKLNGVASVVDSTTVESSSPATASNSLSEPPPPPPPVPSSSYPMTYPDTLAAKTIAMSMKLSRISGVKAIVVNGIVTLTGNANKKDLRVIQIIADQVHPKKVINKIIFK